MNNDHLAKTQTKFKKPVGRWDFGEHFIDIERENLQMTQVQEVFT